MSEASYKERFPYAVREKTLDRRYLADQDVCYDAWCVVQSHAQRYTRDEARRVARKFGAAVVHIRPATERHSDGDQRTTSARPK